MMMIVSELYDRTFCRTLASVVFAIIYISKFIPLLWPLIAKFPVCKHAQSSLVVDLWVRPEQRDDNTEITNCDRINTRQLEMARHVQNKYIWANTKLQSRAVVDSILPGTQPAQRLSASQNCIHSESVNDVNGWKYGDRDRFNTVRVFSSGHPPHQPPVPPPPSKPP